MPNRQSPGSGGSGTLKKQSRVYPELVRSRRFWGYALCMAFSTGGFYAFLGGAPLVASTLFDVPPALLRSSGGAASTRCDGVDAPI